MPLQATSGAASYDGFGGGVAAVPNYIEDVFSTYLYKGNNSTLSINNGIDVSGKGGLVWIKNRQQAGYYHTLVDTVRGPSNQIYSNATDAQYTATGLDVTAFTSTGFTLGPDNFCNQGNANNVSWTFRKQPKFFDVVTYTGNGATPRTISHNLGSVPGCIIVKKYTGTAEDWFVFHRSLGNTSTFAYFLNLNNTNAQDTGGYGMEKSTSWTSTSFSLVSGGGSALNESGANYVAYVFAHNAGGFGLTGTDNVISCGSYTGTSVAGNSVTLGYEPQFVICKSTTSAYGWYVFDSMRGMSANLYNNANYLLANTSAAETTTDGIVPTATGFTLSNDTNALNGSGNTYIYIAIRRGPMKVPTDGTKVFSPVAYNGTGTSTINTLSTNFPVDFYLQRSRSVATDTNSGSRLTGGSTYLNTNLTDAEWNLGSGNGTNNTIGFASNIGLGLTGDWNNPSSPNYSPYILEAFRRAPSFFDEVCYTGNGTSNTAIAHNLTAIPELWIVKARNEGTRNWQVYYNFTSSTYDRLVLNSNGSASTGLSYNAGTNLYAQPTSTNLYLMSAFPNTSAQTYVSYLFATCAGVSKVGTYTGNGSSLSINCGFTGGARFVLIKRTDDASSWHVFDTARGMGTGNDPYLRLDQTTGEGGASYDSISTLSSGFTVNQNDASQLCISGATYIFLAIA